MTTAQIIGTAILLLLLLLGPAFLVMLFRLGRSPQNRTPPQLGADGGNLSPCPRTPNCVSTQAPMAAGTHRVEPIILAEEPSEAFRKIRRWIDAEPGGEIVEDDSPRYLRAEFRSKLFGFVDDLELLAAEEQERWILHMRSAARVGRGDMGVNRKRYESLRALLKQ